jgi:hypothetical protein
MNVVSFVFPPLLFFLSFFLLLFSLWRDVFEHIKISYYWAYF